MLRVVVRPVLKLLLIPHFELTRVVLRLHLILRPLSSHKASLVTVLVELVLFGARFFLRMVLQGLTRIFIPIVIILIVLHVVLHFRVLPFAADHLALLLELSRF